MDRVTMFEGIRLVNVHSFEQCQGRDKLGRNKRPCVIHRPTPHHMRLWPLVWRDDRALFERQCEHGIGHPDPDQLPFWRERNIMYEAVHGCDGCCCPPFPGGPSVS